MIGATAGRGRVVVEGRVVDAGIDARFVVDGADGTGATFACAALTTLDSGEGSVEGSVRGVGDSLPGAGMRHHDAVVASAAQRPARANRLRALSQVLRDHGEVTQRGARTTFRHAAIGAVDLKLYAKHGY